MKLAIVAGIVVANDAISTAVINQATSALEMAGITEVTIFAQVISRELPCKGFVIGDAWTLTKHHDFDAADIVIYHWGIYYDLFNAITLRQKSSAIHFHNCTPLELVAPADRSNAEQSIVQINHAVALAIPVWNYSEFNRQTLIGWGVSEHTISYVPFAFDVPSFVPTRLAPRGNMPVDRIEVLTVGRRSPAKGIHVLIAAVGLLQPATRALLRVRIAGSTQFFDEAYTLSLAAMIDEFRLHSTIEFVDDPTSDELEMLYQSSDIFVSASLHEGLCMPVIEAYSAGCRVIGTTAGNLPFVVQQPDRCVVPDDPAALAAALEATISEVRAVAGLRNDRSNSAVQFSRPSASWALELAIAALTPDLPGGIDAP